MVISHLCIAEILLNLTLYHNIYNGNIFPSLNPAKIFQFISRWTESTKSSAVGPNYRAMINTSNEVKSPLLWEFWVYNFSLRILERVLGRKYCKYKEWVSFFLGSWGMNRSAEQTNRPRTASRFTRFVCPALRFIPHEPRKKDTHSLNKPTEMPAQHIVFVHVTPPELVIILEYRPHTFPILYDDFGDIRIISLTWKRMSVKTRYQWLQSQYNTQNWNVLHLHFALPKC